MNDIWYWLQLGIFAVVVLAFMLTHRRAVLRQEDERVFREKYLARKEIIERRARSSL
jgi:membrane protein implicated in regulation of membrane protease activity